MAEFNLLDVPSKEDPITGKVTFTESTSFRIIMGITAFLIVSVFVADLIGFGYSEWTGIIYLTTIILGYLVALILYFFSRNAGKVSLHENRIEIQPKRNMDHFPDSPILLDDGTEIGISTMQSFRWFYTRMMLYTVVTQADGTEHRFGFIIKNNQKQQQYLEVLESWYRAGYKVEEYDQLGNRVFKINQGKSYEDVQKIKKEYGLDWQ